MKKIFQVFIIVFVGICAANGQSAVELTAKTLRTDAVYDIGETATFIFEASVPGSVTYRFALDGKINLTAEQSIEFKDQPIETAYSLDKPGFLRCTFAFKPADSEKVSYVAAAAAFEPHKIEAAAYMPDDFDDFWGKIKYHLSCIPLNPVIKPIKSSFDTIDTFDVFADCIGMPTRGYYSKPKNAAQAACPAIIFLHGAGVSSARTGLIEEYAKEGFIALEINAHGIANGLSQEVYAQMYQNELKNYRFWGRENQYTSYFTGMFTRVIRGLEFLKSQPEWDGKVLVAYGSSQGGAQSLAAAGLDGDVNFVFSCVTAMCDHGGEINGWPRMVPVDGNGNYDKQILDASMYNDCVNFARKTKAEGLFVVGFIDSVCHPTSVYAAYNAFAGNKEMINEPAMGHTLSKKHTDYAKMRILEFAQSKK